ncbi:helix-turn-helix transcriptional regulator [Arthrobacter sp. Soil762]|uniref:helix-turn-helix transcriptional regulator n=1 Tax=Arthrobacter sp. Soil762 TaxID=1736401 RepID=UPI00070030B6|nr:helix-turn-helix transcriptional regulator [Arthrobacter sp. Soil762]KRE80700.1 hypothetical protein ASG77_01690 [Arthrobacter sp. Soil762]
MAADPLRLGREAFRRQEWANAHALLTDADRQSLLEPDDLELVANAAYLVGHDDEGSRLLAREYRARLAHTDHSGAARSAIWLALHFILSGEETLANAWLQRARRVLPDDLDCVEQGLQLVPAGLESAAQGDAATATASFGTALEIGHRFGHQDLAALARTGLSESLIATGDTRQAMPLLDEVFVSVTAHELSPVTAGIVYCAVIEACMDAFDLPRAQEWTAAFTRWCAAQPDMVPYQGNCQIHRARIMQFQGAWPDAFDAAQDAYRRLVGPLTRPGIGAALYQLAELHRLRGQFTEAKDTYLQASRWVRDPQPGLALLLLTQGRTEAAVAAIRRSLAETASPPERSRLLGGAVEIMLASADLSGARAAAEELGARAGALGSLWLNAETAQWEGALLLAEQEYAAALGAARQAWSAWQQLDAPYESARTRVLMGRAYRGLGDGHSAELEFDAARWAFLHLGAGPDAANVDRYSNRRQAIRANPLTVRETQVLLLVASGKSNREIAAELFLSEKTVAHHASNIFTKLDLTSRAAATAYAYEHGLINRS